LKVTTVILSFLLATIILFSSLRISFTYAYYFVDTAGFIEKLCENKDKPEMQCNGKCHLKKVVEKNTKDDKLPFKDINFKEILLYVVEPTRYEFVNSSLNQTQKVNYNNLYTYSLAKAFDHPPQV